MQAFQLNFQKFCFSLWIPIHAFPLMEAYLIVSLGDMSITKREKKNEWFGIVTKHLDF